MSDPANKKAANLSTFMLSQDYLPEHWNWTVLEQQALSSNDCAQVGQVILSRFMTNGIKLEAAYIITHNQDEHGIWDEYQNCYKSSFTSHHIHFVGKFKKGDAMPIERIAEMPAKMIFLLDYIIWHFLPFAVNLLAAFILLVKIDLAEVMGQCSNRH